MKRLITKSILTVCLILVPLLAMAADAPPPASTKEEKVSVPTPAPAAAKPSKIGLINLTYIGTESDCGVALKAQLSEKKSTLEAKIVAERKKLDTLKVSIESKLAKYSPKQREAKSLEFQKRVEAFQALVRDSEESLMKEQESETNKIIALIEKTVSEYGKANDFAVIGIKKDVLYVNSGVDAQDLTSIILKAVNDAWKKK